MPASGRDEPLSAESIVAAALAVVARDGLARLTMRSVAAELDVTPMAIYYHIPDKERLLNAVLLEVARSQSPLELGDDGWEPALRRYLVSTWEALTRYPGVSDHLLSLPLLGTTPRGVDAGVAFFEDAGFSERAARLAWSFALTYLHGRLSVDARLHGEVGRPVRFRGISARDHFEFGVDAIIAGLRELLHDPSAREPAATRTGI